MYENINKLNQMDLNDKKVIMRADFNVPVKKGEDGSRQIGSEKRITAAMKSIKHIIDSGASKLILMSHMGKPKKQIKKGLSMDEVKKKLSLDIVATKLSDLLGEKIELAKDYLDKEENELPDSRVVLLENTRFYYELEQSKEDEDREKLAKKLASFADVFVNDAFGTCHRKQASVYDVAKFLPSAIGFLIENEIKHLSKLIENPEKPYIAILGGAKVEDKINVIEALSEKVDSIIIIGAMEYAFQKAKGESVGESLCEGVETAKEVLESSYKDKLILPVDTTIAKKTEVDGESKFTDIKIVDAGNIPEGYSGFDIGPKTINQVREKCASAKTILWNGPAGMFEIEPFDKGTKGIAQAMAKMDNTRIIGGGDSVTAIENAGLQDKFSHVSTGGGASLEFIQQGRLPALDILEEKAE